jgi:N-carbamoylputrescine amidase
MHYSLRPLKVALCTFLFRGDRSRDIDSVGKLIRYAAHQRCNLICFPECALSGLASDYYKKDVKLAVKIPGKATQKIAIFARVNKIYVTIGLLELSGKKIYDTAILFSDQGKIILKYRRINPQWHSKTAPKSIYREGFTIKKARTPFGSIAFALCGDIFDNKVIGLIKKQKPDYLIIPMARSFDDSRYDQERWNKDEEKAYAQQIKKIGSMSFLINALEPRDQGAAFGGCFIISSEGRIIAKTKIGKSSTLIWNTGPVGV